MLLVPDKLRNNEMLPCGNLICLGPCVTRCKIITCTKGLQGSINSPHFHKLVICGGVGELSVPSQHMDSVRHACLLSLQGDLIHDVTAVNYMTIQLTRFHTQWTLSHVTSCLLLIQNYPDVVRVAALYLGISRIHVFRESSTVDYPTSFDRSSNLERFQARVQRHNYGSCCSVLI